MVDKGNSPGVLVLTRHGSTVWNEEGRFCGQSETPLTEKGRIQAAQAAEKLAKIRFDLAFCSTLNRAKETLEIILQHQCLKESPIYTPNLKERSWGYLEGQLGSQCKEEAKQYFELSPIPKNGESFAEVGGRVIRYFTSTIYPKIMAGNNVIICGHSGSHAVLQAFLQGLTWPSWEEVGLGNAGSKVYAFDEGGKITSVIKIPIE